MYCCGLLTFKRRLIKSTFDYSIASNSPSRSSMTNYATKVSSKLATTRRIITSIGILHLGKLPLVSQFFWHVHGLTFVPRPFHKSRRWAELSISPPKRSIRPPYNSQRLDHIEDRFHPTRNAMCRSLHSTSVSLDLPAISPVRHTGSFPYSSIRYVDTATVCLPQTSASARRY